MQSNHVSHFWSTQPYHLWTNHLDHEASGPWLQKMPKPAPRVPTWIREQFSSFVKQNWALWTWWRGRCWWWAGDKDDDSGTSHHHIQLALLVSSLPVCFHFVFWGVILHALFYYLCVFALRRQFQSAISSSNWTLSKYVRMGYIILKKPTEPPNNSRMPLVSTIWQQHAEGELFFDSLMTLLNLCISKDSVLFFT